MVLPSKPTSGSQIPAVKYVTMPRFTDKFTRSLQPPAKGEVEYVY